MPQRRPLSNALVFSVIFAGAGCRHEGIRTDGPLPAAAASASVAAPAARSVATPMAPTVEVAEPAPVPRPAMVEEATVEHDSAASFVRDAADDGVTRILFLAGLCSNAAAYLGTFAGAAQTNGGIVAVEGDKPCGPPGSGFHSYTWSAELQKARLEKALAAAGTKAPSDGFTLVGYSAGASIAELMHERWPELFPRLVLIAPPSDLKVEKLLRAHAVVSMSCSLDVPWRMKAGAKALGARGVRATYMEMPKCTHGNVADADHIFGDAFAWLDRGESGEPGE